jgi:hypothetical protein
MYKNELLPNTAIKLRSLINKMNEETIPLIYASPSKMSFVLGYLYDDIINNAVGSNTQKKLILYKDTEFSVQGQDAKFHLDHNVEIIVANPGTETENVYAKYDISDKLNPNSALTEVNNPFISYQILSLNREKYFLMFLTPRQFTRTITNYDILGEVSDFSIVYLDKLYGFELNYKAKSSKVYKYLVGKPEGVLNMNGYNFSIDIKKSQINFIFNKNPDYFYPTVGDIIRVNLYTTLGAQGNFTIPNIFERRPEDLGLGVKFNQERNDPKQDRILSLLPYLSVRSGVIEGGKDPLNIQQIKDLVIRRGSNVKVLTPGEIERKAKEEYALYAEKIRDDPRCLEYKFSGVLRNSLDSSVFSSSVFTSIYDFKNIPINQEINSRIISPKTIYEEVLNKEKEVQILQEPEEFISYYEKYKTFSNVSQYCFPYHIKFDSNSLVQSKIYDMNLRNVIYNVNFLYFNEKTSDESSILNLVLNRDPMNEDVDSYITGGKLLNPHTVGYIILEFTVATSANVLESFIADPENETPYIKYKMKLTNIDAQEVYVINCEVYDFNAEDSTLTIRAYLKTNDSVDVNNRICIRDNALTPLPYIPNPIEFYFLESKINVEIYAIQKNLNNELISTEYDQILTNAERADLYFISTIYKVDNVILFEDLSAKTNFVTDILLEQNEYEKYPDNIYKTYEENVYKLNEDGTIATEIEEIKMGTETVEIPVQIVLHKKGEIVFDSYGNPTILHKKGSYKRDSVTGNYIVQKTAYNKGIIKDLPLYDRIYSKGDSFSLVLDAYKNIFDKLKTIETFIPDGMTIVGTIKNTKAKGEWEIFNLETSTWDILDSISLTFDIGVKYTDTADAANNLKNNSIIINIIDNFISNFDELSFSIDTIFDEIKSQIPNITYLILYSINNYTANQVQSIRKKNNNPYVIDALSVRRSIDLEKSDISTNKIVFKPDITVRENH